MNSAASFAGSNGVPAVSILAAFRLNVVHDNSADALVSSLA
jgi:hypothetical protein